MDFDVMTGRLSALPAPLAAMGAYPQFIVFRLTPSAKKPGKRDKLPIDWRSGQVASAHDPAIWLDASSALFYASQFGSGYGVGFVFTERDPFWFLDIDSCIDASGYSETAQRLCSYFPGAAIEVSSSGRGLHVFGTGNVPEHRTRPPEDVARQFPGLEFYTSGRFVALTGTNAVGDCARDFSDTLPAFCAYWFPPPDRGTPHDWTDGPCPEWRGPKDDDDLIRRAMHSRSAASAFGSSASFADLWTADQVALCRAFPDPDSGFDRSKADAALAQHLAFWTGKDCARIERLMRRSALVRDKWDTHASYLSELTISGCVARQTQVLQDKPIEPAAVPQSPVDRPTTAAGFREPSQRRKEGQVFLGPDEQAELFKGCVYVKALDRVLVPGGDVVKPTVFNVMYGGRTFVMDSQNQKVSRKAWEAFTESQILDTPMADQTCFRPDLPPGVIIESEGRTEANCWWPIETPRKPGDIKPFLDHVAKLIPDEVDRERLLSYLASLIQNPGVKFMWAPLIQGVEGNGKTILSLVIAAAVGARYVHWPTADKLTSNFNGWLQNKLVYLVEDIYVRGGERDILERLKPMITSVGGYEIEAKGVDQVSTRIVGNFIFNSNHKGGLPKTANDRRIAPFHCAQQTKADLARDGLTPAYFRELYGWLDSGGSAMVHDWLAKKRIEDRFNPALGGSAPETTSTAAAISSSRSPVEQEIEEAVEQGIPGFRGDWISSMALAKLLDGTRHASLSHHRRLDILEGMGYVKHPALIDGRVNNPVLPDGGKPRLFVRDGAPASRIVTLLNAISAYSQAQGVLQPR